MSCFCRGNLTIFLPLRNKTRYDFVMTLSKQLTLRLPADLKQELNDYARLTGQSRSAVIREAIALYGPRQRDAISDLADLDTDNDLPS